MVWTLAILAMLVLFDVVALNCDFTWWMWCGLGMHKFGVWSGGGGPVPDHWDEFDECIRCDKPNPNYKPKPSARKKKSSK